MFGEDHIVFVSADEIFTHVFALDHIVSVLVRKQLRRVMRMVWMIWRDIWGGMFGGVLSK